MKITSINSVLFSINVTYCEVENVSEVVMVYGSCQSPCAVYFDFVFFLMGQYIHHKFLLACLCSVCFPGPSHILACRFFLFSFGIELDLVSGRG